MENRLITNNILFMIPSWGDLLGYPILGKYANQDVSKILSDLVIFFGGTECSIPTEKGTLHYLFGLGYYSLQFELQSGKYIRDNRQLTGLVLSDFVYDYMATSKNITLHNDRDIIICENVIKVPVDLSFKSENQKTFIKGALMRNVFIPHKSNFLEMIDTIRDPDAYQVTRNGHSLLSTHWDFYNQILISNRMNLDLYRSYTEPTAGLSGISIGADEHLETMFSPQELQNILEKIFHLKKIYATLEYDSMYLFSILENAAVIMKPDFPTPKATEIPSSRMASKESLFISAESRMDSLIEWPETFKRNVLKELEPPTVPKEVEARPEPTDTAPPSEIETYEMPKMTAHEVDKVKQYELDLLKNPRVESKPLPSPPEDNIEAILLYVKDIIEDNCEMRSVGKAFGLARDNLRKIILQSDYMWEMSKYANIYQRKEANLGLNLKDKTELLEKIDSWILKIKEEERLELERLERERLERERLERERLERERLERERLERERLERERLEKERLEQERLEREKLERERLEKERLEQERSEKERLEQEELEMQRQEAERLERKRAEIERMIQERKEKEKQEKLKRKQEKQLKKEQKKLEKMRKKEEEKRKKLGMNSN